MLIIIEGLDKTGKTTLANYLLKNLPNAYLLKNGARPKDGTEEERQKIKDAYFDIMQAYSLVFRNKVLILDRFLVSEFVYSLKRGYDATKDEDLLAIKHELEEMEREVVLIYCSTDPILIERSFIEDKEDYAKIGDIVPLMNKYEKEITSIKGIVKLPYDYTRTSLEQVARQVSSLMEVV